MLKREITKLENKFFIITEEMALSKDLIILLTLTLLNQENKNCPTVQRS